VALSARFALGAALKLISGTAFPRLGTGWFF
jgi:hypothetical protein